MGHLKIPTTDAEYNSYVRKVYSFLDTNKVRLLIASGNMTILTAAHSKWTTNYPLCIDANTRTSHVIDLKDEAREEFDDILLIIMKDIPRSILTKSDCDTLQYVDKDLEPTTIPLVDYIPKFGIDRVDHLLHVLRITDPTTPHSQAMPYGHKVEVEMAFKSDGEPVFTEKFVATRFLFKINFSEADYGKTAIYRVRYVNNRGKQGRWSVYISQLVG